MKKLRRWLQDLPAPAFWLGVAAVFAARVFIASQQQIYVWVGGAPIDDELMWRAANSITAGQWLGAYDFLTLSKQMFFAVWLAFCHAVGLPYLVAGQLLAAAGALALAQAFAPAIKSRTARFVLFAALAMSPAAAASFTLRVYRDNIFPALCVLFFAGMIGCALRYDRGLRHYWPWLVLAGLGLGTAFLTREDGIWLLPFAVVGSGITAAYILLNRGLGKKALRCAALALPYAMLAAALLAMSAMNYKYYGVFTTSDFSSGSFADAYGAMTRVQHAEGDSDLVPVPESVRLQLYEAAPTLEPLRYWLEQDPHLRNSYLNSTSGPNGDYAAGSFYWALRSAAQQAGFYASAPAAAAYWQAVADEINAAIAAGVLTADVGPRSTTTPIIQAGHVLPTLAETGRSLLYCAAFRDCAPYYADQLSKITAEDAAVWTAYLGSAPNLATVEGSDIPNYRTLQKITYALLGLIRLVYSVLGPVLILAALAWLAADAVRMCRQKSTGGLLLWLILLGLFGMAVFRSAMIAFMEVAAFRIGTYVMYLATVHPLLIAFGVAGSLQWLRPGRK